MIHPEVQKWCDLFSLKTPDEIIASCESAGYHLYSLVDVKDITAIDAANWLADSAQFHGASRDMALSAALRGLAKGQEDTIKAEQTDTVPSGSSAGESTDEEKN